MERDELLCLAVIVIIVVAIVGYLGYSWWNERAEEKQAEEERARLFVETGDSITFEVSGWLDDGRYFYTTEKSVDEDDAFIKSSNYKYFTDEPEFSTVGEELTTKFNIGFTDNVLNMKIDEPKTFRVTPDKGYGWSNESLIRKIPKSDSIPLYMEVSAVDFQNTYNPYDYQLHIGQRFTHVYWDWPIELVEVTNDTIMYRNDPEPGQKITSLPWSAEVMEISEKDGKVMINHKVGNNDLFSTVDPLELADYDKSYLDIQEIQADIEIGLAPGVITTQDVSYFTINFNDERAGKNIWYEVTIIDIEKA